ncbi:MAG: alpha/beta fold hydrolase [Actinomycetia bacterium]|nr:alpha/beta fold hydrolase [Actinomycetes bacterium]
MSVTFNDRTPEQRRRAVSNLFDFLVKGGVADTTRMPSEIIAEGHKSTLHRYLPADEPLTGDPVLFVPPLGSQATCFDLRRGCSLTEHLVNRGRPTYLVDYGKMGLEDRDIGIEFFVSDVVPNAIRTVSRDAGGAPVHLIGWCLGGLIALLTTAAYSDLPIKSVTMVASPFDLSKHRMVAPLRTAGKYTGGRILGGAMRVLGGLPSQIVGPAFKATSLTVYLKKPVTLFKHRDDREFLAQVEAVDGLMNSMLAYPGRATLQIYQRLVQRNELAEGTIQGPNKLVDLADVRVPVMNVAGTSDVLVPVAVAHHVGELLPNCPEVRLETAPGGHLGVLTGRSAPATTWVMIDDFLDKQPA